MADEIAEPKSETRKKAKRALARRRAMRLVIILGIVLALAALSFGAWRTYDHFRSKKEITNARSLVEKRDYVNASVLLQRVLKKRPNSIEATRLMAELTEAAGSDATMNWRREMVRLEPGVIENHLAFAKAALRFGDRATAEQALAAIPEAGKQTAAYHEMATRFSTQSRQFEDARAHMVEAARLDPKNEMYQFDLALLDLRSISKSARTLAHSKIEEMTANPKTRSAAYRVLIGEALMRGARSEALNRAEQLARAPGATFEDQLAQLDVLHQLKRREFWWCLVQMERQAEVEWSRIQPEDPLPTGLTMTLTLLWQMNRWKIPSEVLAWTNRMPVELKKREPVGMILTETHTILNDWPMVGRLTQFANWGPLDWKRKALYARSLRTKGEQSGWIQEWRGAVKASGEKPETLVELARLVDSWKWDDEVFEVLWLLAANRTKQATALKELNQKYYAAGRTRELLKVAQFSLDAAPADNEKKNNVAYLSMLLANSLERAFAMAAEIYQAAPANPQFAATHAFGLYLQKKNTEGLKILRLLSDKQLQEPSVALSYGLLLAANGSKEEARSYLDLAARGILLPEEQRLIAGVTNRIE